ncbi:hypothetical protein Celaphus_00006154, partial [Cervus elaphus hippelaphus]
MCQTLGDLYALKKQSLQCIFISPKTEELSEDEIGTLKHQNEIDNKKAKTKISKTSEREQKYKETNSNAHNPAQKEMN